MSTRGWEKHEHLPFGCVRSWVAKTRGKLFAVVYETGDGRYLLAYKKVGDGQVTVERHMTRQLAHQRAVQMLNTGGLVEMPTTPVGTN